VLFHHAEPRLPACARAPRRQTLWTCAIVMIISTIVAAHQPESVVADRAFAFFVAFPAGDVSSALGSVRPPPVSIAAREAERARLPLDGALQPDPDERARLVTLTEILRYHERTEIVVVTVIDVPQAFVGLHARSILLISRPAMRLVSAVELQALVAHEMGHDYFWSEYQQARERRDLRTLREVELKCDGIAALTLVALGLAPTALESAERKVRRFNETRNAVANADAYPSSLERQRFIRAVILLRAQRGANP
jgi:Peptidase family M48